MYSSELLKKFQKIEKKMAQQNWLAKIFFSQKGKLEFDFAVPGLPNFWKFPDYLWLIGHGLYLIA